MNSAGAWAKVRAFYVVGMRDLEDSDGLDAVVTSDFAITEEGIFLIAKLEGAIVMEKEGEAARVTVVGEDGNMRVVEGDEIASLPVGGVFEFCGEDDGMTGEKDFKVGSAAKINVWVGCRDVVGIWVADEISVK